MCKPLVSIIIPVYNVENYLSHCIDSAINQTLRDIEIILVDDGSTDSSGEICDKYSKIDERIRVIHKMNGGLSDARNAGSEVAVGEYIYFLDSDDWIEQNAMEALYIFAEERNLDMVLFDSRVVDENGEDYLDVQHYMRYYRIGDYRGVMTGTELFHEMIEAKEHYSSVPLLFIKKSKFTIRFDDMLHEDELFTIRMLYLLKRVAYYPELLYVRRIRQGSIMTVGKTPEHFLGMVAVIEGILRIENKDKSILRYTCTLLQCAELIYQSLNGQDKKKVQKNRHEIIEHLKKNGFYGYERLKRITKLLPLYPLYDQAINSENSFPSRVIARISQHKKENRQLREITPSNGSRLFIMGVPTHGNLGDHAIAISQYETLKELCPEKEIIEIDRATYVHRRRKLSHKVTNQDIIVVPGGGWLGNQWYHNEIMVEDVCRRFKNNKVIILPQTVYFEECKEKAMQISRAKGVFTNRKNLLFFVRDGNSMDFVKRNLNIECQLVPDMVLRLHSNYNLKRSGVLVCFRSDCEGVVNESIKKSFISWIKENFNNTKMTTTVIGHVPIENRMVAVEKKLREFARAELVVTDRLHSMIFAAITGTPCVAFDNSSKKVSGVYEWIRHLDYICKVDSEEEAKKKVVKLYDMRQNNYLPPSFSSMEDEIKQFINK